MNWSMVGALGEVAGAIAVVLTLWYLARQIRDNARQDRRLQYTQLNRDFLQLPAAVVHDRSFAEVFFRGASDPSALSPADLARFNSGMLIMFRALEALFQHHRQGGLDDWGAESTRTAMVDIIGMPGFREFWAHRREWFSPEFRGEVDEWLPKANDSILLRYYAEVAEREAGRADPTQGHARAADS